MIDLIQKAENLKNKPGSKFRPGSLEKIYEYNEKSSKDQSGIAPVYIKPVVDEKKVKKILS